MIAPVDVADMRSRLGDEALVRDMLRLFADEAGAALDRVLAGRAAGDASALKRAAHYLEGMAANISAGELRDACGEVERRAKAGDGEGAGVEELKGLLDRTLVEVRLLLS